MRRGPNNASKRNRRRIIKALLDLLDSEPFPEISVRQITDRAELVRRTFYSHFDSKEEVLKSHFDSLCSQLASSIVENDEAVLPAASRRIFEFWQSHAGFLRVLRRNGLSVPEESLEKLLIKVGSLFKSDLKKEPFTLAFLAGGLSNLLGTWALDNCRQTPEEMAETFISFADAS